MVWLYVSITLAVAAVAYVFGREILVQFAGDRFALWAGFLVGAGFLVAYLVERDRDPLILAIGLLCFLSSALARFFGHFPPDSAGRQS